MTDQECFSATKEFLDACEDQEWTITQTTASICWLVAQVSRVLRVPNPDALVEFHSALIAGMESRDPAHLTQLLAALSQESKEVH